MSINKYDSTTGDLIPIHSGEVMYADSPIGTISIFSGTTLPNGYLWCNGAEYDIVDYPELYAVLGSNWNGTKTPTTGKFFVPDLRELVPVGASSGNNTTYTIAAHDTYDIGTFKDDQVQEHNHYRFANTNGGSYSGTGGAGNWTPTSTYNEYGQVTGNIYTGRKGTTTHGKQIGVNYIIKAKQSPMPADMQGEVDDINGEITQIKSDLNGTKQPIGTTTLTLATGNGTKTVAQLMNEGFATLTAYRPSTNGATHFRIESFDAPIGGAGIIKKLISLDRNIVSAFTDVLVDASAVAPRADGIYGFGARIQSTGSMLKRIGVSTSSEASYVDWSTNTVDNNIKFTVLITLYKSF